MPKKIIDLENKSVTIVFDDEATQTLSLNELSDDIVLHLALHGLSQKAGDSYAGAKQAERPLQFSKDAVEGVWAGLLEGKFRQTVAGGAGPRITMLAEALSRATGCTVEKAVEVIDGMEDDEKKALRKHPGVKASLEAIKAERAIEASKKAAKEAASSEVDLMSLVG